MLIASSGLKRAHANDDSIRSTHVGMAHFAGTGPAGTNCCDCAFFAMSDDMLMGRCKQWQHLMRSKRQGERFPASAASCRHFVPKAKK